jgi:hypothetical protein
MKRRTRGSAALGPLDGCSGSAEEQVGREIRKATPRTRSIIGQ